MGKSVVITVRVDSETSERLDFLVGITKRSKSYLAGAAISDYVAKEMAVMEGIEAGLADRDAGRVVPHDKVMDDIDDLIGQCGQSKP
jgi:Predicted transcriptional regulator